MSDTSEQTLDPLSQAGRHLVDNEDGPAPTVEIVFHSDLRRIGCRTLELHICGNDLVIGRHMPLFESPDGFMQPLDDPCISRQQLTIKWIPGQDAFLVTPCANARRKLEMWTTDGEPVAPGGPIPPGTVVSVGDRVMLLLTLRSLRRGQDLMNMVGDCEVTWTLRDKIRGVAAAEGTVLLQGESGAGKELVATAIHDSSKHVRSAMMVVNCAAIPENLLESVLFGHVKGAFTGADSNKDGFFKAAGKGTLFLDEIGELPLALQSKLLRVLQEHKVCPVGALKEEPIHARVVAATNRDLKQEVVEGRFREDLYYRLSALTIRVPPLRERRESIPGLFNHFFRKKTDDHPELERLWRLADQHPPPMPQEFFKRLFTSPWPGNIRQLWNAVEKVAAENIHTKSFVVPGELEEDGLGATEVTADPVSGLAAPVDRSARARRGQLDQQELVALLEKHDFVQRRVAQELGISHTTLDRWMREIGLRRPRDIPEEELVALAGETGDDLKEMARRLKVSPRGLKLRLASLGRAGQVIS